MIKRKLNKKADIPVTILVLGILALMIFALLSFYLIGEKIKVGGINSVFHLQEVYNNVESAKFSGVGLLGKYGISEGSGGYILNKTIIGEPEGLFGILGEKREILKIKYTFSE
jgi:hypothetical protein